MGEDLVVAGVDFGNATCEVGVSRLSRHTPRDAIQITIVKPTIRTGVWFDTERSDPSAFSPQSNDNKVVTTVGSLKRLVGERFSDAEWTRAEKGYFHSKMTEDGIELTMGGSKDVYSMTHIFSMFIRNVVNKASQVAQGKISQIVIAVPVWYTDEQRRAILSSSQIAGLPSTGLMCDITAVALSYGIRNYNSLPDHSSPINIIFADIGQCDCTIAVVSFSEKRMTIQSIACDDNFGGRDFDHLLAMHFAEQFRNLYDVEVLSKPKTIAAIYAECQLVKEALSSSKEAFFRFDAVLKDISVKSRITRQTFENIVRNAIGRIPRLLNTALQESCLETVDINVVELSGGSAAIPCLQDQFQKFFDDKPSVNVSLDRDTAVAQGATYACAMLFAHHPERKFRFNDLGPFPRVIDLDYASVSNNWLTYSDRIQSDAVSSQTEELRVALSEYIAILRTELDEISPVDSTLTSERIQLHADIDEVEQWIKSKGVTSKSGSDYAARFTNLKNAAKSLSDKLHGKEDVSAALATLRTLTGDVLAAKLTAERTAFVLYVQDWLNEQESDGSRHPLTYKNTLRAEDVAEVFDEMRRAHIAVVADTENAALAMTEWAIPLIQVVIKYVPPNSRLRAKGLFYLGQLLHGRYLFAKKSEDIDDAIASLTEGNNATSEDNPNKIHYYRHLGRSFLERWRLYERLEDLEKSITNLERSRAAVSDAKGAPEELAALDDLGDAYMSRYTIVKSETDVDKAIQCREESVQKTPNGHSKESNRISSLAKARVAQYYLHQSVSDINNSILAIEVILPRCEGEVLERCDLLHSIGQLLDIRYSSQGNTADLDRAHSYLTEALQCLPRDGEIYKSMIIRDLIHVLSEQYERYGDMAIMQEAMSLAQDALRYTASWSPSDEASYLCSIGFLYLQRYDRFRNEADINQGIEYLENASRLTLHMTGLERSTSKGLHYTLGEAFLRRYARWCDLIDIDNAISSYEKAMRLSLRNSPDRAQITCNLSIALSTRYELLGYALDIDRAIQLHREGLSITPDGHPEKARMYHSLGQALSTRFERSSHIFDIDEAIHNHELARRNISAGHPYKPICLVSLALAYIRRFQTRKNIADIEKAILRARQALYCMPSDHLKKPAVITSLGASYLERAGFIDVEKNINMAISCQSEAVDIAQDDDSIKSTCLRNLGSAFETKFNLTEDLEDLKSAVHAYSSGARLSSGSTDTRFESALQWSRISRIYSNDDVPSVLEAYTLAFDLIPRLAWLGVAVDVRYAGLRSARTLACDAAAAAIDAAQNEKALEWLEEGRSIVWAQTLQLRSPLDDLHSRDPELAKMIAHTSANLDRGGSQTIGPDSTSELSSEENAQKHHRLAEQWESLIGKVREIAGFERFMLPKLFSELRCAAFGGPVVLVNVSEYRCDALIITAPSEPLRTIPLETLSEQLAKGLLGSLHNVLSDLGVRDRGDIRHGQVDGAESHFDADEIFRLSLRQLWFTVVKPVIDCLGLTTSRSAEKTLPRIWWIPTGPVAFLPIHAAGVYANNGLKPEVCLSDYAVSSYAPSLGALINASRRTQSSQNPKLLAIIQPSSPGASRLPGTKLELMKIQEHFMASPVRTLQGVEATVAEVLSGLEECPWVHMACHGVQDIEQPTKSGVLLEDGRLELSAIIKKSLPHADLAFLSACQTATGNEVLPDEAIHLAAGMLLAGYRRVIATMWSIGDNDAPFVTDRVYAQLLSSGQPDSTNAARALQIAVLELRDKFQCRSFASWVPFIHVGA